jgi:geranylgeranyl diphosphate synthase, type I
VSLQAPESLTAIVRAVDAELQHTVVEQKLRWSAVDADLELPLSEVERLVLSGGKRIRPAFCYWGFRAAGGNDASQTPIRVGAAIELLHVFALFHDDIMDGARTRRGQITSHTSLAKLHNDSQWAGESRRFGDGAAILIGDLAHVMSDQLLGDIPSEARHVWHEMRLEVNIGQYLDMLGSARRERSREVADRICRYKSAKYTIERPLHLGALTADVERGSKLLPVLSQYGLPLGDAFQLRDDVLGVFGDSIVTGKPVGDDLREGKPTPLLASAYELADASQRTILDGVGSADLSDDDIIKMQSVIRDTGALIKMEQHISSLRDEAVAVLQSPLIDAQAVEPLEQLAHYVTDRVD